MSILFYLGHFMQLMGLSSVGLCFFSGMYKGDYGKLELWQLVGGAVIFYLGHFIKRRRPN